MSYVRDPAMCMQCVQGTCWLLMWVTVPKAGGHAAEAKFNNTAKFRQRRKNQTMRQNSKNETQLGQ